MKNILFNVKIIETVFGEVTDGMETADAIVKLEKDGNDCPLQDAKMTKVTVT